MRLAWMIIALAALLPAQAAVGEQGRADEWKVAREEVFDFAQAPTVSREGDRVTIRFAAKGRCDVTIAIEDAKGGIVRHLASGVLGANAPEPFARDALAQAVVWDGKDDQGRYVVDREGLNVRVSLGLSPRFERTLLWDPHRRISFYPPLICPAPEGVYVCEGKGVDLVRLMDHDGNYIRTVYPFPADKLAQVKGLEWRVFPQDGARLPVKQGFSQATLLNSGCNAHFDKAQRNGIAATAMAVHDGKIALAYEYLDRLSADGTSGGLELRGTKVGVNCRVGSSYGKADIVLGPSSAAFSPDGKWVYLTGYLWKHGNMGWIGGGLQGVMKAPYAGEGSAELFAGEMTETGHGTDAAHFRVPSSVACDGKGRVYVADFLNDRVQVFSPEGKLLRSIATTRPAVVQIDPRGDRVWVFSFFVFGVGSSVYQAAGLEREKKMPSSVACFGPLDDPKPLSSQPLPLGSMGMAMLETGQLYHVAVDPWAKEPTLWVVGRKPQIGELDVLYAGSGIIGGADRDAWADAGIRLLVLRDGKWRVKRDFGDEVEKRFHCVRPADHNSQRLYVNPKDGRLYVFEQRHPLKSFEHLIRIDPDTGATDVVQTPFEAEDMCFDINGLAYLRTDTLVARFDPANNWREVPWDYGEERVGVHFNSGRTADLVSTLGTPGHRPVCFHQGGMWVSPTGHLAVSCCSQAQPSDRKDWKMAGEPAAGKPYAPTQYPGRSRWQEIHVWDDHGKLVREDAIPGLGIVDGLTIDSRDNLYVMAAANRIVDGKPYFNELAETVIKFRPAGNKVVSSGGKAAIPLDEAGRPARPADISGAKFGQAWAGGAQWFYGGVGYGGFDTARTGGGCACWHARFTMDYFDRSFAPEVDHYSVAVLDSAGNLVLRIGHYGNVDDGKPLIADGGPPDARSIGGDEVGLFHACYLVTQSDRRLFIADAGNARLLSVKLDYHASRRLAVPPGKP